LMARPRLGSSILSHWLPGADQIENF